jgi:hypothetical protein
MEDEQEMKESDLPEGFSPAEEEEEEVSEDDTLEADADGAEDEEDENADLRQYFEENLYDEY